MRAYILINTLGGKCFVIKKESKKASKQATRKNQQASKPTGYIPYLRARAKQRNKYACRRQELV